MRVIDLSHTLSNDMPVFPGDAPACFVVHGDIAAGDNCVVTDLSFSAHTGTHIDCGAHIVDGGFFADEMEVSYFIGKGIVVDCSDCVEGGFITLDVLKKYDLSDKCFVLLFCDWARFWGTAKFFTKYPILTTESAKYLSGLKNLRGIGIESISVDHVDDGELPLHKLFMATGDKCIIENLCNMEELIGRDFTFAALPLKIKKGEASPVRAIAIL